MQPSKLFVPVFLAVLSVSASAEGGAADDIKILLEKGKAAEAYGVGRAHAEQLGEPLFDFYFGIAALDSGNPGEGVLALERYVLLYTENRSARFHLARGYYILGEDQRARDEFEGLRALAKDEELATIERYLDAIRARESRYQPTAGAYVEIGGGYDSNINSGVNVGKTIVIPGFASTIASPNDVQARERDWFQSIALGAQGTYPVAPGVALYGGVALDYRTYSKSRNDVLEQLSYGGNGGVSYLAGKNLFRVGANLGQQLVGGQNYLFTYSLSGEWVHQYDQFNRLFAVVQTGRRDYDDTLIHTLKDKSDAKASSGASAKTDNFHGLSVGWTHLFVGDYQPLLTLSANYGKDDNQKGRSDFSRDTHGVRVQFSMTPAPRWGVGLGASYSAARHLGLYGNGASTAKRDDSVVGLDAIVSYRIDKTWSARMEGSWVKQESNIGLFDYDKAALAARLRYEFN